jgi:hypothetical protein
MRANRFFIKCSKCIFGGTSVAYLGHVISTDGVAMNLDKVSAVDSCPFPRTLHTLRGFLGLIGYHQKFIAQYGEAARPLTALLKHDAFSWYNLVFQALSRHNKDCFGVNAIFGISFISYNGLLLLGCKSTPEHFQLWAQIIEGRWALAGPRACIPSE